MKSNIAIIGIHQFNVGSKAGGYIRLKEFLKYAPSDINCILIDLEPSIYSIEVAKKDIIGIHLPSFIQFFLKHFQVVGILFERIFTGFKAYYVTKKVLQSHDIKVLYVPIGEFLHLYLPAILLKKSFPEVRLVVDILNFKIYKEGFLQTIKNSISNSNNKLISLLTAVVSYVSFTVVKKTIHKVDYIFSVSPELVETIKEIYPKNTINYTPSGVDGSLITTTKIKKKYLGVYIGRVTEQKGVLNLIDVWKKVVLILPDAQLAIAGLISPEILESITIKIKEYELTRNITVIGEITEKEKAKIISESEIFLHLANYEPLFPVIGILEGLVGGLPAVVYDMKVLRPVVKKIQNNNFLYVIENGNIEKNTAVVLELAALSEKEKVSIKKNARNYALQFEWKEIAKKEFAEIRKLINEK